MQIYKGNEYELRVSRVKSEDMGEYCVRAENSFGRKEECVSLKVEGKCHVNYVTGYLSAAVCG